MKQRIKIIFAGGLLTLTLFGVAAAGPLEDGVAAGQRGDYAAAVRLLRPLAEQGNAIAQGLLGMSYATGGGVPQDYAQAAVWYRKAADQGYAPAQFNLGNMYYDGQGVQQDYAQAVMWYRKAADQGLATPQYNLGLMYSKGQGVPQDYVQAHMWFNLAASRAVKVKQVAQAATRDLAVKARDLVAAKMTPSQIAEAQRMAREWVPK
jgi:TPR repeat protein